MQEPEERREQRQRLQAPATIRPGARAPARAPTRGTGRSARAGWRPRRPATPRGSFAARAARQRDERFARLAGVRHGRVELDPHAARRPHARRSRRSRCRSAPRATARPRGVAAIVAQRVAVIGVHVRDDLVFGFGEPVLRRREAFGVIQWMRRSRRCSGPLSAASARTRSRRARAGLARRGSSAGSGRRRRRCPRPARRRRPTVSRGRRLHVLRVVVHDQAGARIGRHILRVLGEPAHQDHRPARWSSTNGTTEPNGYPPSRSTAWRARRRDAAQIAARFRSLAHPASRRAVSARRRPSAMQSCFSASSTGRSDAAPATWLAP